MHARNTSFYVSATFYCHTVKHRPRFSGKLALERAGFTIRFQSLIVRLKTETGVKGLTLDPLFQSLIVRLKTAQTELLPLAASRFQSLIVRLKTAERYI